MYNIKILTKQDVLKNGYEFDGDIVCYSGEYGQQVCDSPTEEGGKPITGIVYELYENGNLNYYDYYVDGIKNGETVSFYEDGNLKSYGNMFKGTRHGKTIFWHENGQIKSESDSKYSFDLYCKEWDERGNLIREITGPTELGKSMIAKYDAIEEKRRNEQK